MSSVVQWVASISLTEVNSTTYSVKTLEVNLIDLHRKELLYRPNVADAAIQIPASTLTELDHSQAGHVDHLLKYA